MQLCWTRFLDFNAYQQMRLASARITSNIRLHGRMYSYSKIVGVVPCSEAHNIASLRK